MGVIQNTINQALGTAGIAARLSRDLLEERQKQAMKKVAKNQAAKQKQKRNFMSYLKEQPTSLGGKVGELPLNIQKQIAQSYSPKQRKQLMDTMDKEKMNKNGK